MTRSRGVRLSRAALAAAVLSFAACGNCHGKPVHESSVPAGIHIPLPEGWAATVQSDRALRAGPKGRSVLRVDVRSTPVTDPLPTPATLSEEFAREGTSLRVTPVSEVTDKDLSLVVMEVSKQGSRARAMLGVKRVGRNLMLCSSEPGASEGEVGLAAEACQGLSEGGGDR